VSESIILIGANRKIQLLNSTAAARLGSVVEDLIDADYLESIPFHTREVREKKLSEVIETGKMVVFNEEKESYNYLISYYPSTNPEGMVEFVAEFSQDITERRLATEHINSLRQKVLRSQMNPHFIFNSLNAIQSYVLKNDAPQAVKYLNSFARLIRMILDSSRYDYITLAKEIKILEYYLELQQLRFGDKFIYQLEIDKNLDIEGLLIPAMLAQPFIENSIEHGLQHLEDKGKVKISFVKVKNSVVFKVVDNGIGREASYKIQEKIQHKDTSLSTQLFKERLYTLNKFSGKKITYNIVDLKDDAGVAKGTMVIINLPLIYKSDLNHN
jgi:LytS/YehU family sensor histidine kinase